VDCNIAIAVAISGLLYGFIAGGINGVISSLIGLVAGVLILEIVARAGYLFAKTRAMGEADTYVAGAIGAMFGINNILEILLYSLIASMIFIVPVFLYNRFKSNDTFTCICAILFTVAVVVYKSAFQNWLSYSGIVITGICLAYSILKSVGKEENRNYLPFVPALSAGVLYYIITSF